MTKYTKSNLAHFFEIEHLSAKFGQLHSAVTIMATDNHVPQFSEGGVKIIFGK